MLVLYSITPTKELELWVGKEVINQRLIMQLYEPLVVFN